MASPPGYPLGGGTLFSMWPRIALVILSRALVPYCGEEKFVATEYKIWPFYSMNSKNIWQEARETWIIRMF